MVEAEIAFLAPCKRRPVFHDIPSDKDFLPLTQHIVPISAVHDERTRFTLDRDGIEIVQRACPLEYQPAGEGRIAYLRALEEFVASTTGAVKVVALGNGVVRRSERSVRHRRDGTTVLGRFAHCDFSPSDAGSRFWVEHLLSGREAQVRLARRYAIYNVWQCLTDPPQDTPLGGQIGIHGLGHGNPGIHNAGINWTSGCVALDNRQIEALRPWVKVGMRVEIR